MIMYLFPTTLWCGETPHLLFTELTLLSLRRGWRENLVRRERNFCEQKEGETVSAGSFFPFGGCNITISPCLSRFSREVYRFSTSYFVSA